MFDLKGKKVTVVGLGISGMAAARFLRSVGAQVYATDAGRSDALHKTAQELESIGVYVELGRHTREFITGSELVVTSPGVQDASEAIIVAGQMAIPIISEIELASWFCKGSIIAVTGTNGKSTVVTLIGKMINASGRRAVVCGNIGDAFCGHVDDIGAEDIAVVEVSSFQLKRIRNMRPKIAAITNISQNHFDWHTDINDYIGAKKKIYKNQTAEDFVVLNYDDPYIRVLRDEPFSKRYFFSRKEEVDGGYFDGTSLILNLNNRMAAVLGVKELGLRGEHNKANALCAALCSYLVVSSLDGIRKTLKEFKGLDHRFQHVADIDKVSFVDDSKATTVDACRAALTSCDSDVILIAGGRDKGSDFTGIRDLIAKRVKSLILIGEATPKIRRALTGAVDIYDASDMDDAVAKAKTAAQEGDIVLLSPMCASFDMYEDYKHRGRVFCESVARLKHNERSTH